MQSLQVTEKSTWVINIIKYFGNNKCPKYRPCEILRREMAGGSSTLLLGRNSNKVNEPI